MNVIPILVRALLLLLLLPSCVAAGDEPVRVLVLGDSLTAGYGLPFQDAFPVKLEKALQGSGYHVAVINASVAGDTTAGGLARLDWALADKPQLVIIELGANDALRGLDPQQTRKNLDAILERLKREGVAVLLTGMRAPRNLGSDYYNKFDALYPELAKRHRVAFYPFFLEGVATLRRYNQSDGLHPNEQGVELIVQQILPVVAKLLSQLVSS